MYVQHEDGETDYIYRRPWYMNIPICYLDPNISCTTRAHERTLALSDPPVFLNFASWLMNLHGGFQDMAIWSAHEQTKAVERPWSEQVGEEEPCGGLFLLRLRWLRLAFHLEVLPDGLPDGVYCLLIDRLACRTADVERVDSHPASCGHLCSSNSQAVLTEDAGDLR